MPNRETPIRLLMYELRIALLVERLFGPKKALLFVVGIPMAVLTGKNRTTYALLGACTTTVFGKKVTLPHPEPRFIDEVVLKQCYTKGPEFEIRDGMTIIDSGANVGIFAIYAALRAPNGKVIAMEPDPETFAFLRENISANYLENVTVLNAALADKSGTVLVSGKNPGSKTISEGKAEHNGIVARALTLSEVITRYNLQKIDFLKVDIEGAEFLLLNEPSWLPRTIRIAMEVHPALGDAKSIVEEFRERGCQIQTSKAYDSDTFILYAVNRGYRGDPQSG